MRPFSLPAYDAASEMTSQTDRNGRRRDFTYDALGRATQELWFDSSGTQVATITSSRDLLNNLTTITNATGTVSQTSDPFNRLLSSTDVWGIALTNTYNAADQRTGLADSTGGVATWTYDTLSGRLTRETVSQPSSSLAQIDYSYNHVSQVNRRTYGGTGTTITTDYAFNGAGQTTTLAVYTALRNIETLTYVYDVANGLVKALGRNAWRTEADAYLSGSSTPPPSTIPNQTNPDFSFTTSLTYDSKGQMTSFGAQGFSYDGIGNLNPNGTVIGAGNRLLQDTLWNYQYDLEGNLVNKTKRTGSDIWDYSYDNLNRMIEARETTVLSGTTYTLNDLSYRYDGLGRRVERVWQSWTLTPSPLSYAQNPTVTQRYSFDGQTLLFDLDGSNGVQSRYVTDAASGQMLARLDTSGGVRLLWYVSDKGGAVIDLLDTAGRALKRQREGGYRIDNTYLSSARQLGWVPNSNGTWTQVDWTAGATIADRFGFGGQELELATGLLYTGMNWYDQALGRFINEQSGGLEGKNAYRYALNSPQNVREVANPNRDFLDTVQDGYDAVGKLIGNLHKLPGQLLEWGMNLGRFLWTAARLSVPGLSDTVSEEDKNHANDFFWGTTDTLTAGLTGRGRRWLGMDSVDYNSEGYRAGAKIGQVANIALMFIPPVGLAMRALQAAAMVGSAANGIEAYKEGRIWDSAMSFAGGALAGLRGITRCQWTNAVGAWGQGGLHAIGVGQATLSAGEKWQQGDVLGALLDLADAGANAYKFMQSCFAAGTPIRWECGSKLIEEVREGDLVWSRNEFDPDGPVVLKRVEEVFVRVALVLNLHVNGRVIRTTAEHPIYVEGKGWTACAFVRAGERIRGEKAGEWLTVEAVTCSGEVTTVYNFRVADYHTYFVGCQEWGFDVWAHNSYIVNADGSSNSSRAAAFSRAKIDAGIPRRQQCDSVRRVVMTDKFGQTVKDSSNQPIMTREYTYTRADGSKIVIQDHSAGHSFGNGDGAGDVGPHFNVRPVEDLRHGVVPGTLPHYPFS